MGLGLSCLVRFGSVRLIVEIGGVGAGIGDGKKRCESEKR